MLIKYCDGKKKKNYLKKCKKNQFEVIKNKKTYCRPCRPNLYTLFLYNNNCGLNWQWSEIVMVRFFNGPSLLRSELSSNEMNTLPYSCIFKDFNFQRSRRT